MEHYMELIFDALNDEPKDGANFVPSDFMTLEDWRNVAQDLGDIVQDEFEREDFGFSGREMSALYRQNLESLSGHIDQKLKSGVVLQMAS